jgi:hypothetical protein
MTIDTIERQRKFLERVKAEKRGMGIVLADAFLRGMRDLGYKDPSYALAEMIDNSFQAGAPTVSIRFKLAGANPISIAVSDDGNGMLPDMISQAVRWGGTDRPDDRTGFGRYGYGLPSSAISLAKRYTVYAKAPRHAWHSVTVDIEKLAKVASDAKKVDELLAPSPAQLPEWLVESEENINLSALKSGTIIVLEELDRLQRLVGWIRASSLGPKLLRRFGVIYRYWLDERRIFVDGTQVQPLDPLFLMEKARHYDENGIRAERVETRAFEIENSEGKKGVVSIRAALLPPNFQLTDPAKFGVKGVELIQGRHGVMKEYNGLIFCRGYRQIACIPPTWTKYQNYDANLKIEINFDPELDEYFGITTSKQQIVPDEEMWERLRQKGSNSGGLYDLIRDLRGRLRKLRSDLKAKAAQTAGDAPKPSEAAMQHTERYKGTVAEMTEEQKQEALRHLEKRAKQVTTATGTPYDVVLRDLTSETSKWRWGVSYDSVPEGPFYRPERLGERKCLIINTDHSFYSKVYESNPALKPALEVLLFVLAERELECTSDFRFFYRSERSRWSDRLRDALDFLISDESTENETAVSAEESEEEEY